MTQTRRHEILAFIMNYARQHNGPTPSIREIAIHFRIAYTTCYTHIEALIEEGVLTKQDGKLIVIGAQWVGPNE